ncbi:MAG: ribonuclease III [Oceanipulchritudo sp.]|jgi:ribonuclease-3
MAGTEIRTELLEERIGYAFRDKSLLVRSLTHPSYAKAVPEGGHYQRLEFLGDAVLGLVLAEALFHELPEEREGPLTRYRSMLVKGRQLELLGREIGIGAFVLLGEAEVAQGGRDRPSIIEDAFEAMVGAVYLDGGLEAARNAVLHIYGPLSERLAGQLEDHNPKGKLQELLQPRLGNEAIEYRIAEESGPDHEKNFTVEVWIEGNCRGRGSGNSKRLAEEAAAREALEGLPTNSANLRD